MSAIPNDPIDPIGEFQRRWRLAGQSEPEQGAAMTLATADGQGRPSARVVLLKGVDERGFSFFTNFDSRKASELLANPQAALCFYWPSLAQQVRVEGPVERLPEAESDAYFKSRPRGSQLGAWASRQSARLVNRAELEARFDAVALRFKDQEVQRPPFWGGYRLAPKRLEFWQGRDDRLHDRLIFERRHGDGTWERSRLYP